MKRNELSRSMFFAIVIGIVVSLNIIAIFFFTRFDLTDGDIYSLSDSSKKVIGNVDDKVIVKAYFTENMPPQLASIAQMVKDYLDEYKAYSNGNLQYEFLDPASDPDIEKEATGYRIPSAQVNIVENDEIALKKVYLGLVLLYEDKKEIIPFIQQENIGTLEYDLTSIIKKLTSESMPKMGIVSSFGCANAEETQTVRGMLEAQYELVDLDLATNPEIPADIKNLIMISPKDSLTLESINSIEKFINDGGKAGFFVDMIDTDLQTQSANPRKSNINDLLGKFGLSVNNDLVGDLRCTPINVQRQQGMFRINTQIKYPFLPLIEKFETKNIVVSKLENISLFFASSINSSKLADKYQAETILESSVKSFVQSGRFDINASKQLNEYNYDKQKLPMGVLVTPKIDSSSENPVTSTTRIALFGDGEFMQEGKSISPQNYQLFMNIADWLNADSDLISIRSKEVAMRPIDETSEGMRKLLKFVNILLAPMVILIAGLMKWQLNRSRKSYSI
ncbi:MAG: GldG family protein [Candidatus Delongbacteria bacterium]|nr:GldG family protein [Candidatus Delongbacteria bacterium]MBN2835063.1 GldG family protein [Candidatus Delongbacteria bacterium]